MAVFTFGSNLFGQLGVDTVDKSAKPIKIDLEATQVSAGYLHTLALVGETVYSWGCNDDGALGKDDESPSPVELPPVRSIAAGGSVSCAITKNDELYVWGTFHDASGVFGITPEHKILTRPLKIREGVDSVVCAKNYCVVLTKDKRNVLAFGVSTDKELGPFRRLRNRRCLIPCIVLKARRRAHFIKVVAGERYGGAIDNKGDFFTWQKGDPKVVCEGVKSASIGDEHEHVVKNNGGVFGRGSNRYGQVGVQESEKSGAEVKNGKRPSEIISSSREGSENTEIHNKNEGEFSGKRIKKNGAILVADKPFMATWTDLNIDGGIDIKSRIDFTVLKTENGLYSWGPSMFGETGFDDDSKTPRKIPFEFGEIIDFSVGSDFTVVASNKKEEQF